MLKRLALIAVLIFGVVNVAVALAPLYWAISVTVHLALGLLYSTDTDESGGVASAGVQVIPDPAGVVTTALTSSPADQWTCFFADAYGSAVEACTAAGGDYVQGEWCWFDETEPNASDYEICVLSNNPDCPAGYYVEGDQQSGFTCETEGDEPLKVILRPDGADIYTPSYAGSFDYVKDDPGQTEAIKSTDGTAVIVPMTHDGQPAASVIGVESTGNVVVFEDTTRVVDTPSGTSTMRTGCWMVTDSSGNTISQGCVGTVADGSAPKDVTATNPPINGSDTWSGNKDTYSGQVAEIQDRIADINAGTGSSGSTPVNNDPPGGGGTDPIPDPKVGPLGTASDPVYTDTELGNDGNCDPATDPNLCQGVYSGPVLGEVPTIAESASNFYNSVSSSPIANAASSIVPNLSNAACPTWDIQLFGESIPLVSHCAIWDSVTPILETFMLGIWAFLAVVIFLSS